jgi:hypothetical protein
MVVDQQQQCEVVVGGGERTLQEDVVDQEQPQSAWG